MKYFLLFVAIIGVSAADDLSVFEDFLECVHRALYEGVPSIPLPKHDPLLISNITYSGGDDLLSYKIGFTNNVFRGLLNYTFPVLNASSYHNPEGVAFGYDIYWPAFTLTGDWEIDVKIPSVDNDLKGTYNIAINEIDWWGIFNVTKSGQEAQGYNNTVNAFSLESKALSVDVTLTGAVGEGIVEEAIELALLTVMNNFPASLGELIRTERLVDFWIGEKKINVLLDWCGY